MTVIQLGHENRLISFTFCSHFQRLLQTGVMLSLSHLALTQRYKQMSAGNISTTVSGCRLRPAQTMLPVQKQTWDLWLSEPPEQNQVNLFQSLVLKQTFYEEQHGSYKRSVQCMASRSSLQSSTPSLFSHPCGPKPGLSAQGYSWMAHRSVACRPQQKKAVPPILLWLLLSMCRKLSVGHWKNVLIHTGYHITEYLRPHRIELPSGESLG